MKNSLKILFDKTVLSLKKNGTRETLKRIYGYLKIKKTVLLTKKGDNLSTYGDVLFINGCYLPHPVRYRISHQREQLLAKNIFSSEVMFTDITLDMVDRYRTFVLYRCPFTETVGQFIEKIHEQGKKAIFDIDDLLIDQKYTETIAYINEMSEYDREIYYKHIELTKQTLCMCDVATTTTSVLAEELKKYVPEVYINRNLASDRMLRLSQEAFARRKLETKSDEIVIGYFSGSITHNEDLEFVTPALKAILDKFENVKLLLVGDIEIPHALKAFSNRISLKKYVDWQLLPKLIATVDINIAPIIDTLFNRAKSENKWTEAALVHVPTIASDVGAFAEIIQNGKNGILVKNEEEWFDAIEGLVINENERKRLADNAYRWVLENSITVTKDASYAEFIKKQFKPNIAFVLPEIQIRGGIMVALKHASFMQSAGYDTFIITINADQEEIHSVTIDDNTIPVFDRHKYLIEGSIDKAVATLWSTVDFVCENENIGERLYLVQNYETDFVDADTSLRNKIERTYNSLTPLKYVTISKWCQQWLQDKYNKPSQYVMNGLDTNRFYPTKRNFDSKIKILIEGNSNDSYKNVDESFEIVNLLDKNKYEIWYLSYEGEPKKGYYVDKFMHMVPYEKVVDIYRECDILLKTSILESFSYPPLEMMATGGYVVAVPNGGNAEYLVDEYNALLYEQGHIEEALKCIERIANDEELRVRLYSNGIKTAEEHNWDSIKDKIVALYK